MIEQVENGAVAVPIHVDESDNEEETGDGDNNDIRGSDDDEQEDPKDYCKGGYHPVTIGSVFNQRYHVIRKLGWGMILLPPFFFYDYHLFVFSFRSFFDCLALLGS